MTEDNSPVIAIELGHYVSRVGVFQNGEVTIFQDDPFQESAIPSFIHFKRDGERVIGSAAKALAYQHRERTIFAGLLLALLDRNDEKLKIALDATPEESPCLKFVEMVGGKAGVSVELAGHTACFYVEQVVAMLLSGLKDIAEKKLGREVSQAVIIIPTGRLHFKRIHSLQQCAAIAGLTEVRFLSRTQAALIWHEFNKEEEDDDDDDVDVHDVGEEPKKNSYIKVIDFDYYEGKRYAASVVDVKKDQDDVLKEVYTSQCASTRKELLLMTKGVVPHTWVVIEYHRVLFCSLEQQEDLTPNVEGYEKAGTIIKLPDPKNCTVSGAAVYAAFMLNNKNESEAEEGLQLKAAVPSGLWLVSDDNIPDIPIMARHSLFEEKVEVVIRSPPHPVAIDGGLHLKIFEEEPCQRAKDFLGTIQIFNFETAVNGEASVKLLFQVSFNGSFDVTAICERSGQPCSVVFGTDWFSHSSFSKEHLEAFRRQEIMLGAKGKSRGIPGSSNSNSSSSSATGSDTDD